MAKIMKTDGSVEHVDASELSLERMQEIVGGYIEFAYMPAGLGAFIVDEEGKLKSKPVNEGATRMYQQAHHSTWDVLVGDVILVSTSELKEME
jgi:hypothetical protein